MALVVPAVFDLAFYGTLAAHPRAIDRLSFWSALVLIAAYGGSLIYAFTAQRDLFGPGKTERAKPLLSMSGSMAILAAGTRLTTVRAELLILGLAFYLVPAPG